MAKRKTPKVKDLRPEKITKEQLETIQETINKLNRSQLEIGAVELRKHELLHGIAGFRDELSVLQGDFQKEYGTFDINITDGTINYPEDGEANS
jgi:hypothetical protein